MSSPSIPVGQELMFLQTVLREYEQTNPDWRNTQTSVDLMQSVLDKLATAATSQTLPEFTTEESEFLQEILLEFEQTHLDWKRRLDDFYLMLGVNQAIGQAEDAPSGGGGGGGGGGGSGTPGVTIQTAPVADPYFPIKPTYGWDLL